MPEYMDTIFGVVLMVVVPYWNVSKYLNVSIETILFYYRGFDGYGLGFDGVLGA